MQRPELSTAATMLQLALDGSDVDCVQQLGLRRHLVIQQALRLADDPEVALEHPELVRHVRERAERRRARRRARY